MESEDAGDELAHVAARWRVAGHGEHYRDRRWRRRRDRDPRLVARLLAQHAADARRILDVPSGSGRLAHAIEAEGRAWFGMDAAAEMLSAAPRELHARRALARADRLPLRSASVDAVVCCRLLHHLEGRAARQALLGELARVTRGPVIVSFWDRDAWPSWRRRLGLSGPARDRRIALTRGEVQGELAAAGLELVAFAAHRRYLSAQTFAVARRSTP